MANNGAELYHNYLLKLFHPGGIILANILLWLGKLTRAALYLFIALIVFYAVARFYVVYTDSQVEGVRTPYLQMQSSDGVTVMWNTAQAEIGVVRYGKSANGLDQIAKDKHPQRVHEIRIKDLEPATRYFYSVGVCVQSSTVMIRNTGL